MSTTTTWSLLGVLLLVVVHVLSDRFHRDLGARPAWLSAAGGVSISYVVVELLPRLAEAQAHWLEAWPDRPLGWLESQVYVAVLIGLLIALGVERTPHPREGPRTHFWLSLGAFATYNLLVGAYALRFAGIMPMLIAVVAFGGHFLITDRSLRLEYGRGYRRAGRWLIAGALLFGWILGSVWHPPVVIVAALLGLLSGSILLQVVREELEIAAAQAGRARGRNAFVGGAIGYTALLLALEYSIHDA